MVIKPPEKPPKTGSWLPLSLAGCLSMLVLLALIFITLGVAAQAVAIGGVLFAVVGFHYLVWGRWLGGAIRAEVEADERERLAQKTSGSPGVRSHER